MRTFDPTKPYDLVVQYATEGQFGACSGFTSVAPYVRPLTQASSALLVDERGVNDWVASLPLPYLSGRNLQSALATSATVFDSTPSKNALWFRSVAMSGAVVPVDSGLQDLAQLYSNVRTMPAPTTQLSGINANGGRRYEATRVRGGDFSYDYVGEATGGIPVLRSWRRGCAVQKVVCCQREAFTYPSSDDSQCVAMSAGMFTELGVGIAGGSSTVASLVGIAGPIRSVYDAPGAVRLLGVQYGPMLSGWASDYCRASSLGGWVSVADQTDWVRANSENGQITDGVETLSPVMASGARMNRVDSYGADQHPGAFVDYGYDAGTGVGTGLDGAAKITVPGADYVEYPVDTPNTPETNRFSFELDIMFGDSETHLVTVYTDDGSGGKGFYATIDSAGTVRDQGNGVVMVGDLSDNEWHHLVATTECAAFATPVTDSARRWTLSVDGRTAPIACYGSLGAHRSVARVVVQDSSVGTDSWNRVYVDNFGAYEERALASFAGSELSGGVVTPTTDASAVGCFNLNGTADSQGIADIYVFYDEDLEGIRGCKTNYFGGHPSSLDSVLSSVERLRHDVGACASLRGELLVRRAQGACLAHGDRALHVFGVATAGSRAYGIINPNIAEDFDCMTDTASVAAGFAVPLGVTAHQYYGARCASVSDGVFGLAQLGMFGRYTAGAYPASIVEDIAYPSAFSSTANRSVVYRFGLAASTVAALPWVYNDTTRGKASQCWVLASPSSSSVYCFGGKSPSGTGSVATSDFSRAVERIDLPTMTFSSTSSTISRAVEGAMGCSSCTRAWVAGGTGAYNNQSSSNRGLGCNVVWTLDYATGTVSSPSARLPQPRGHGVATTPLTLDEGYFAGGGDLNYNNPSAHDDVTIVDFTTDTACVRCETALRVARVGHTGCAI